jgi:hypothetical protein
VVAVPELVGIEGKTQEKANIEVAASVKMMTRSSQICLSYLSRVQKTSAMMLMNMNHLGMLLIQGCRSDTVQQIGHTMQL